MADGPWWRPHADGIVLAVRVTPGASRDEVLGPAAGRLRVRVAAPPAEGMANDRLCRLLARELGVRPSAVTLRRGTRSREKEVVVTGLAKPPTGFGGLPDPGHRRTAGP